MSTTLIDFLTIHLDKWYWYLTNEDIDLILKRPVTISSPCGPPPPVDVSEAKTFNKIKIYFKLTNKELYNDAKNLCTIEDQKEVKFSDIGAKNIRLDLKPECVEEFKNIELQNQKIIKKNEEYKSKFDHLLSLIKEVSNDFGTDCCGRDIEIFPKKLPLKQTYNLYNYERIESYDDTKMYLILNTSDKLYQELNKKDILDLRYINAVNLTSFW